MQALLFALFTLVFIALHLCDVHIITLLQLVHQSGVMCWALETFKETFFI